MKWKKIFTQKLTKLEEQDDFWKSLKEEINNEEAAGVLIPLLKDGK